jgi:perosamine synthetase
VIPVFRPELCDDDVAQVMAALRRGDLSGTAGETVPAFERALAATVGTAHAVACSSGTAALQLAVAAARIGPGDEVLLSSSTNIATALAIVHNGALPVPVDSECRTGNLNLSQVEALITPRTKAIIPVHLFGHPVDMDALLAIATRHGLVVIEDCAQSLGASVRGRMTGTFGAMACFSFYANKVVTTGEGGAVLTDDGELAERLRSLRNLAFGTPRFVHHERGFNFRISAMQAALGTPQLSRLEAIVERKRRVAHRYIEQLAAVPHLELPVEEPWARHVYWMCALVLGDDSPISRDALITRLAADGIETRTWFCPMNLQPCLRDVPGFRPMPHPVAERLWARGLYLPSSPSLDDDEIDRVASALARHLA